VRGRGNCSLSSASIRRNFYNAIRANFPAGSAQRVGVARALAADPPILLMDEPFGALDPPLARRFAANSKRCSSGSEKTIVIVTHDTSEALLLGTRIGLVEAER